MNEKLKSAMALLKVAETDMARLFNVPRQDMVKWLSGTEPGQEYASVIDDLAEAAEIITGAVLEYSPLILQRKIHKGKNFFEAVRDGVKAQDAARLIVRVSKTGLEQRERLNSRLTNRTADNSITIRDVIL